MGKRRPRQQMGSEGSKHQKNPSQRTNLQVNQRGFSALTGRGVTKREEFVLSGLGVLKWICTKWIGSLFPCGIPSTVPGLEWMFGKHLLN